MVNHLEQVGPKFRVL